MDQKYKDILEGAMRMFGRIGIRSVSMDDIAQELHMSKKTIYLYFKNKEELVAAMLKFHLEMDLHGYECICIEQNNKNAIDALLEVSQIVCKHQSEINPAHVFELQKYYPEQFKIFWDQKRVSIQKQIKENIEQGIEQNLYRKELNVELITALYCRRLEEFSFADIELMQKFGFEQVFKTMFESHIRGISNQNGLEYFEKKKKELNY